jgi:heat shock protein HslJ
MTNIARMCTAALGAGAVLLAHEASSDPIHGRWQVRSLTSTTLSFDGREKIKGPFVEKPADMSIVVGQRTYVLDDAGKRTTYSVRRAGRDYILTRSADGGPIAVRLSRVAVQGKELRFTSTRLNRPRQERYIVQFVCVAAPTAVAPRASLAGTQWQLVEIAYNDDRIVRPKRDDPMTLEFSSAGRATGVAGLNRFNGTCRIGSDRSLSFGELAITRAAVLPGSVADTYIRDLKSANRYLMDEGMLVLELPYDTGVMKFRKH